MREPPAVTMTEDLYTDARQGGDGRGIGHRTVLTILTA